MTYPTHISDKHFVVDITPRSVGPTSLEKHEQRMRIADADLRRADLAEIQYLTNALRFIECEYEEHPRLQELARRMLNGRQLARTFAPPEMDYQMSEDVWHRAAERTS